MQNTYYQYKFIKSFATLLILLIISTPIFAATYYVATDGNDANPGTETNPWKTINKATRSMQAGDIAIITSGTYSEHVQITQSGTSRNLITYMAKPGDKVIIEGSGITLPNWETGLIDIENVDYIKISGFDVRNAGPNQNNAGIYLENANNIIIENNRTFNTVSSGIGIWNCTNIIIDGNTIELACNDGEQECLTIAESTLFEIKNNHIHNGGPGTNGGEGLCVKDGSHNGNVFNNLVEYIRKPGIYLDAWDKHTYNIAVYNNRIHSCIGDGMTLASEQGGLLEDIRVYNNIIFNNQNHGISIVPNGDVPDSPMQNMKIINNTIFNNGWNSGTQPWGGGITLDSPKLTEVIIRNNITSQNLTFQIAVELSVAGLSIDHNLIDGFRDYIDEETRGLDYVEGDPIFIDTSAADFHISDNSPAINKGSAIDAPSIDFDGNTRPSGNKFDIGAFEYVGTTSINGAADYNNDLILKQNYPNPFNFQTSIEFEIKSPSMIYLSIYKITGELVFKKIYNFNTPDTITEILNLNNLAPGMYFYKIEDDNNQSKIRTMLLLR